MTGAQQVKLLTLADQAEQGAGQLIVAAGTHDEVVALAVAANLRDIAAMVERSVRGW